MKLIHGDCLEKLKELPDNSVDLVLTSPPYDNLRSYNGSNDWSFDKFKVVASELKRILKYGGVIVWVVGDATIKGSETCTSFRQALYFKDVCGLNLHDTMVFLKEGPPLSHNRYEQKFEYMFVFSKGKPSCFNGLRVNAKHSGETRSATTMRQDGDKLTARSGKGFIKSTKLRGNVWEYGVGFNKTTRDVFAYKHPAIFPEALVRDHILSWSNEGETVLDPFMGSGTTGKMCKILNRNFIGIEREAEYIEIARRRIAHTKEE